MNQLDCSFSGYNNIKIYAKKNIVENAKANIVIVHGVFEHLDRYDYLVNRLNDNGYNVYRYDARGHGRSEGNRGDLEKFDDFLLDLDIYIDLIKKEYPNLKIVLLGHSMGGLVATSYSCMYDKIDFLALSGACNVTPKQARPLKYIPTFLTKLIKYKNVLGDGVCGNKEVVEAYNNDPLVLKSGKMRLMKNSFIKGCKLVNDNISRINIPVLVMHGKKDGIVVKETGEWTYSNLSVKDKTLKMYEGLYHEIFNEVSKDVVIDDLINWINNKVEENNNE